ncbi:hypothetical protein PNOK_0182400 [Pyrrhoderma noxium]|uniref:Uncharacterized protein n=1 Tax=Pyrrhoderma noxium TaxID=2282107 RepID=A0A286UQK8_9AGAM|nr:hypothetical protein PNOK_0182400 [Pyrrhoderma noxium]
MSPLIIRGSLWSTSPRSEKRLVFHYSGSQHIGHYVLARNEYTLLWALQVPIEDSRFSTSFGVLEDYFYLDPNGKYIVE